MIIIDDLWALKRQFCGALVLSYIEVSRTPPTFMSFLSLNQMKSSPFESSSLSSNVVFASLRLGGSSELTKRQIIYKCLYLPEIRFKIKAVFVFHTGAYKLYVRIEKQKPTLR